MKRLALLIALIFVMMVASVHPAEAATVEDGRSDDVAHVVHIDHEGAGKQDNDGDQQGDDGIGHHHCPTCWIADATPRVKPMLDGTAALITARYASLSSRSDDPLLEPPAA